MTTGTIICASGESLCYRPGCGRKPTLQCDYRVDHWGRTCNVWMCRLHAMYLGWGRAGCDNHEPPKNQGRMAL